LKDLGFGGGLAVVVFFWGGGLAVTIFFFQIELQGYEQPANCKT
jgi:hypothetical protein